MEELERTQRTTVRRLPKRGAYDRETVNAILDEGLVCHVGFVADGVPMVVPTGYARVEDRLLLHGSSASRMMRALGAGADVCVTVTLLDGLVLAESAFHHSMNYRSVVVLGRAEAITESAEKMMAFAALTERLVPGRWADVRWPTEQESKATAIVALPVTEASAKMRMGGPSAEEIPHTAPVWTGVLPLKMRAGTPVASAEAAEMAVPEYVTAYERTR